MDFTKLTPEQLNKMDKQVLITIIGSLQGQLNAISSQLDFLTQQIALMNQRSFGRKTEQLDQMQQITLFDYFNEPELLCDDSGEPKISEVIVSGHTRKTRSKREDNPEGLPARIFEHTLDDARLAELFPDGHKELPVQIYKRLSIIPQTLLVDEHHVHVYAAKNNDGTIVKADRPADVFRSSIATPSLLATVITGKYQNRLPLERQSRCFQESGVKLEPNTLANWMIRAAELHFSILYDELHKCLLDHRLVHADESPFEIFRDGRKAGTNSCMWVYRNGKCDADRPIVLYDYQATRSTVHPERFLKGFFGIAVTDGCQAYHTLEKRREGLKVAGCWVHAKRKFAELIKSVVTDNADGTIAAEATNRISELFHLDNQWDDLNKTGREKQRQLILRPKVDDFFAWAKSAIQKLPAQSTTRGGLQYCINQEQFLRVFLDNGDVPMDNNLAEQAIRPFTIGRKNWVCANSIHGARASAVLYSIVETAKANDLRVYDYLEYLIDKLAKHSEDTSREFLKNLLPWSQAVQEKCKNRKKS